MVALFKRRSTAATRYGKEKGYCCRNKPDEKWRRLKRLRRRVTRRETRLGPAALEDDDDGADDDDVAKWEHPLISTGKFLNKTKQTSLA